jgi:RNA polymerase sigma-70 factor (ECF subfamily)
MTSSASARHRRFDQIYADNLPLILGYAARRCAQPGDAADVAAEVFLTAWRRMDDLPEGRERLWLFGAARRVLANQRRGLRRKSVLADRLRAELLARPPVRDSDQSTRYITDALATLPDRDREVLTLVVWDGLTPTEIAELDNLPPATVRSQLMRARTRLRAALGDIPAATSGQRPAQPGHVSGETSSRLPEIRSIQP